MATDPTTGKWIGYGPGDVSAEVERLEHRLLYAYPRNSQAAELGVQKDTSYTEQTAQAVANITQFMNHDQVTLDRLRGMGVHTPLRDDGIANLDVRKALGAYVEPVYQSRFPIQGVWADSRAFLNPPDAHSFQKATNDFAAEGMKLYAPMAGRRIWCFGYSMGGVSVAKFLNRLRPEWRQFVEGVVTWGDPSMPAEGSLLGNDDGEGISKYPQPVWVRDRYWSYSIAGDWYPRARGLLFLLYDVLTHAELTMDFAMYLFTKFPQRAMQELMGTSPSSDPLAGVLGGLAGLMTSGPVGMIGSLLSPMKLFALLPDLMFLLFDAIKFIATNAHGKYADPSEANWDGMTALDHAVRVVQDHSPNGATLFLFPGTWSNWNQLIQFDVAARLQ